MVKDFSDFGIELRPHAGDQQSISCPKCSHQRKKKRSRCLSVNTAEGIWLCHHCGWKGTLASGGNYSDPHWLKPDYRKPNLLPSNPNVIPQVMTWFITRGICADVQLRNKINVSKTYMPQLEKEVQAIGFPYFRDGEHINTKWRDKEKNFKLEAGAELLLYGLDDIKDAKTVIWVEGEMDKLSVEQAGYRNCISVPNGAPPPNSRSYSSHFDYLARAEDRLAGKTHILFLDSDEAGKHLEGELSRRLGKEICRRIRLPDGFKDANEYLMAEGPEALAEVIEASQPFPVTGIHEANSLRDGVNRLHEGGLQGGVSTGWLPLDQFYTVRQGEMTVVTGIPNHGKSNFLDCMTINIARQYGWRFGVFSPENQPLQRHAAALLEKLSEKAFKDISKDEVETGMAILHDHYFWILPELEDDWTLKGILDKAKTLVYRYGINGLILDPWNEIEHHRTHSMSETEYISSALTQIRQFARLHNVHVWVVAHPAKLRKNDKNGTYPVPTPYDISGSAHWRNKADNSLTVHRPDLGITVEIHVQKIRFKEVGKLGMATLEYDLDCSIYREISSFNNKGKP